MEMDCCWAPSPSQPSCFHKTATTVDNTDGYLSKSYSFTTACLLLIVAEYKSPTLVYHQ